MTFQLSDLKSLNKAYMILFFYSLLMAISATVGWYLDKEDGFTKGYLGGIAISLGLWFMKGKDMSNV